MLTHNKRMLYRIRRWLRQTVDVLHGRAVRTIIYALIAVLFIGGFVIYGLALWKAPDWVHAKSAVERYNSRVLVISIGGATVVALGLLYTARNYRLSRRGQVTDRFTKALEQLGSTELYVRIGAVHALEHVMRDSASHQQDVAEVLLAFIRHRVPLASPESMCAVAPEDIRPEPTFRLLSLHWGAVLAV